MTRITEIKNLILSIIMWRAPSKTISAVVLLLALLMPITAPIPAWAYDLRIDPAPVDNSLSLLPPQPSFATTLADFGGNLYNGVASLLTTSSGTEKGANFPLEKLAKRVKQIETPIDKIEHLALGQTIQLSAIPLDENGNAVHGIIPEWVSKNRAILKIEGDKAIAKGIGEIVLTVKAGNVSKDLTIKVDDDRETVKQAEMAVKIESKEPTPTQPLLVQPTEQDVRDSTYTPENNLGAPAGKSEMDSPNPTASLRIRHRAGIANYSFGVPFASLPGRGIDASIGMNYNSRVWNKTGEGSSAGYQYDVDQNWLAPGFTVGYGKLKSHFASRTVLTTGNQYKAFNEVVPEGFTDAAGARHRFECRTLAPIPNTQSMAISNLYCTEYATTDGTFIKVAYHGNRPLSGTIYPPDPDMSAYASTFFTLSFPDGTKIKYSAPGAQFAATDSAREHYPVQMQDNDGNQMDVAYQDGKDNIEYIRDTLGRYIRFYYDPTTEKKLVAVTVPGFDGGADRQTIRLYYDEGVSLAYQGRFSGTATGPTTYRALRYVCFPATGGGYRYDYHPNFGMITKITKLAGMTVTGNSLTSTGTVNTGAAEASTTQYLYPIDGSQTPLTDVPKYTQRTDDWQGRTPVGSLAPVTYYDAPEPAPNEDQISEITVPGTDFDTEYRTVQYNTTDWHNGLTKETTINKLYGPGSPRPYSGQMARTVYTWDQGTADSSGRRLPILVRVDATNDTGQIRANTFVYDAYNNQTVVREHDFAAQGSLGTELRRTEITYETGTGWINNGLIHLPKEVKTIVNSAVVSRVVYEYDNYGISGFAPAPGVVQHNAGYDPNSGTHDCNPHYVCDPGDYPPHCPLEYDQCPNYDPGAYIRGNVTKVINFPNTAAAENDPNNSVRTFKYDITGNVVEASMSCCNVKTIEYAAVNQYAYATKETKGSGPQLVNEASYDFNTGLVKNILDENSRQTSLTYDPATLLRTRVDSPNGAWSTVEYNDTQFPYSVKSTSSIDNARSISNWSFYDGAGRGFRSRSQTANGYISSDVEFDNLGRAVRSYNPYTVAGLGAERPSTGVAFTEVTKFDALGRTLETKLPDATIITAAFSGVTATMTDQALKKRRQTADALGRIVRVDEPNTGGQLDVSGVPYQPTYYEYDGNDNLAKVTQTAGGTSQERVFQYDALSRLKRERQVEASPTLDDNGVHGSPASTKWTGVYNYNADGLLTEGFEARGVKTTLAYDGLNRVQSITYTSETGYQTPQVTYTYSETEAGFYNKGRLTKIQTAANTTYGIPATVQNYDYDSGGHVKKHIQSIGSEVYSMEYGYNLAGQLVSEKYPSGKIVNMTVDNFGVTQTVADSQKSYLTGITFNNQGALSQISLGNGTTESYGYNDRFQMTSQSLQKNSNVLQKYEYSYGQVDVGNGNTDTTKNNGQLGKIEGYIGSTKQWSQRFTYDELGRLSESREYKSGDNGQLTYKQKFEFDRFGNLYRKAAGNPTSGQANPLTYTPIEDADISKATNRFTSGLTYNEAGQVTADTKFRGMGFLYDANGRLVKATKSGVPDALTVYDALGNRVAAKVNNVWQYMIYDALGQLVAEYGTQAEGTGGVKFVQQDWQGSVRAITNNNGHVVSRTDHQAFGEEIGVGKGLRGIEQGYTVDSPTRQGYGLTENDSGTGQQNTWFRKLETQAGRWSSPDRYNGSMNRLNPQSFNRYSYVQNEPTNYVDPSGLMCWTVSYWTSNGDGIDHYDSSVTRCNITAGDRIGGVSWVSIGDGGGGGGETETVTNDGFCFSISDILGVLAGELSKAWAATKNDKLEHGGAMALTKNGTFVVSDFGAGTATSLPQAPAKFRELRKLFELDSLVIFYHTHPSGNSGPSGIAGKSSAGDYGTQNQKDYGGGGVQYPVAPPFGIVKYGDKDTDVTVYNGNGIIDKKNYGVDVGCWYPGEG